MTRTITFIILIAVFLVSFLSMSKETRGSEDNQNSHDSIDPAEFNKYITEKGVNSIEEIFKLYYSYDPEEEGGKPEITSNLLDDGRVEGVLIHDRLPDDSVRGIRIIMTFKPVNPGWEIIEILESHRCWEGRGHSDWGVEECQ